MEEIRQLQGNYTLIPNELIKGDQELDSKELSILILLYMARNSKDICIFSLEWLYKSLHIKPNNSTGTKRVKQSINPFWNPRHILPGGRRRKTSSYGSGERDPEESN
jgi:hypothetical protein